MKRFLYSKAGKLLVIIVMLAAAVCAAISMAWAAAGLNADMDYNILHPGAYEASAEMASQYLPQETGAMIEAQEIRQKYFKNNTLDLTETIDISDPDAGISKADKNPDLTYTLGDLASFYDTAGYVYLSWILENRDSLVRYDADHEEYAPDMADEAYEADAADETLPGGSAGVYGANADPAKQMTILYDDIIYDLEDDDIDTDRERNGDDRITVFCYPLLYNVLYNNGLPLEKKYILNASGGTIAEYAQQNLETVSILDSYTNLLRAAQTAHALTQQRAPSATNAMIWLRHTESGQVYTNVDAWKALSYEDVKSAYESYTGDPADSAPAGCYVAYDATSDTTSIVTPASAKQNDVHLTDALQQLRYYTTERASAGLGSGTWQIFVGLDAGYTADDSAKDNSGLYTLFAAKEPFGHHALPAGIAALAVFLAMLILSVFQTGHRAAPDADNDTRHIDADTQTGKSGIPDIQTAVRYPSKRPGICTTQMERVPLELLILMDIILWAILAGITLSLASSAEYMALKTTADGDYMYGLYTSSSFAWMLNHLYAILIPAAVAFAALLCWNLKHYIRRIKAGILGASLLKSLFHAVRKVTVSAYRTRKEGQRLVIIYSLLVVSTALFAGICGFAAGIFTAGLPIVICIIVLVIAHILILRKLMSYFSGRDAVRKGMDEIAAGNLDYKVNTDEISGYNKEMAEGVNKVSAGLRNAVENEMKSERLKTDLITNVSHDIKTPLTSIISYVDILKRKQIGDDEVRSYIEILDRKSSRLKQLVDDLVESSKISSGNISLELRQIDFSQLIRQMNGEFQEKFKDRNLSLICSLPDEPMLILADSARLCRVIENLYNNAAKYAMPGSRIYVDGKIRPAAARRTDGSYTPQSGTACDHVTVTIRNVSEYPLNISADELTERFVRGDLARTTEGSGLGLEIARNLTVMQHGTFDIVLDGDLFKVTIGFAQVQEH